MRVRVHSKSRRSHRIRMLGITEISETTGLTAHTLRYYEKEQLLPDVRRDPSGRRYYTEDHLKVLKFITALRNTGMPIATIKQYIELYQQGESTAKARMALLTEHEKQVQAQLEETKRSLKMIRKKIGWYEEGCAS